MKKIAATLLLTLALLSCSKDDVSPLNIEESSIEKNWSGKKTTQNNKYTYSILITEDMEDITVFGNVLSNLLETEYIHSTVVGGINVHQIMQLPSNGDLPPFDNDNPNINISCDYPSFACWQLIQAAHLYNLDTCEDSDTFFNPLNGTYNVIGWGCNIA